MSDLMDFRIELPDEPRHDIDPVWGSRRPRYYINDVEVTESQYREALARETGGAA